MLSSDSVDSIEGNSGNRDSLGCIALFRVGVRRADDQASARRDGYVNDANIVGIKLS